MSARRHLAALALAATAPLCLVLPERAAAYCLMRTVPSVSDRCSTQGELLRWWRRCLQVAVDPRVPPDVALDDLLASVRHALRAWGSVQCEGEPLPLQLRMADAWARCQQAEFRLDDGNVSVVAFAPQWAGQGLDPTAYALTTVWHDVRTGQILDADLLLNPERGPYVVCPEEGCRAGPNGEPPSVDLPNTVTHEMGHWLGLGHSEVPSAAMAPMAPRGETRKRWPQPDDVAGLCALYPPDADFLAPECDWSPHGGADFDCEQEPMSGEPLGGGLWSCRLAGAQGAGAAWLPFALALLGLRTRRRRPVTAAAG